MLRNSRSWKGRIDDMLPGVSPGNRAFIRRYQPYRRGPRPKAIRLLRNLSDIDKHRVMVPVTRNALPAVNVSLGSSWVISDWELLVNRPTRLKVNTPLLRVRAVRPDGFTGEFNVNVGGEFPVVPTLPGGHPLAVLGDIRETVLEILSGFDTML